MGTRTESIFGIAFIFLWFDAKTEAYDAMKKVKDTRFVELNLVELNCTRGWLRQPKASSTLFYLFSWKMRHLQELGCSALLATEEWCFPCEGGSGQNLGSKVDEKGQESELDLMERERGYFGLFPYLLVVWILLNH